MNQYPEWARRAFGVNTPNTSDPLKEFITEITRARSANRTPMRRPPISTPIAPRLPTPALPATAIPPPPVGLAGLEGLHMNLAGGQGAPPITPSPQLPPATSGAWPPGVNFGNIHSMAGSRRGFLPDNIEDMQAPQTGDSSTNNEGLIAGIMRVLNETRDRNIGRRTGDNALIPPRMGDQSAPTLGGARGGMPHPGEREGMLGQEPSAIMRFLNNLRMGIPSPG